MAIRDTDLAFQLQEFKERHSTNRNDEIAFEHFVNYYVLSNEMRDAFSLPSVEDIRKEVHTGGSGDLGIDGIALLVNGKIASTIDDVYDECAKKPRRSTDATIYFIQTTTQDKDDWTKVQSFLAGVETFLSYPTEDESEAQDFNPAVRGRWKAYHYLRRGEKINGTLRAGQPTIKLFYVYPGHWAMPYNVPDWWQKPNNLPAKITSSLRRMDRDFRAAEGENPIRFNIIDARRIKDIHDNVTRRRVETHGVEFRDRKATPPVEGVTASFLGVMKCKEYVEKIVCDPDIYSETGDLKLNQKLALDNVRLFLGDNKVNTEIANTIRDDDAKKKFMLLNNGITIVAEAADIPRSESAPCSIFNYQIVNGWQTSNVLFENYEHLDEDTYVPVRLVITEDRELTEKIVRATNMQTQVSESQFLALNARQHALEAKYNYPPTRFDDLRKINYRRQVSADHLSLDVPTIDIVTQMECYVSMFLGQPHQVHRQNYGNLLIGADNKTQYERVFNDDHPDDFFYVAGYTLCEAKDFIHSLYEERDSSSAPAIKFDQMMNYKHHLLYLFRIMNTKGEPPKANSTKKVEDYRDALLTVLSDKTKKEKAFHDAVSVLDEGLTWYDSQDHDGEARRWVDFTDELTKLAAKSRTKTVKPRRPTPKADPPDTPERNDEPQLENENEIEQVPADTSNHPGQEDRVPAPPDPSAPPPGRPDNNILTGTITGFVMRPSKKSDWHVRVSTSDGESKEYMIRTKNVRQFREKLTRDNAVGKEIRFKLTDNYHKQILRSEILSVS